MENGIQALLFNRKAMFTARAVLWSSSDNYWHNWREYNDAHYMYSMRRREFLSNRRHERTAAALAAANAEIARLRAALVTTFGYVNYMTRYYGINPHMLSGSFSDDLRNLVSIIGTALNPEANHENG